MPTLASTGSLKTTAPDREPGHATHRRVSPIVIRIAGTTATPWRSRVVIGGELVLMGDGKKLLFAKGRPPRETEPGADLSDLLHPAA